MATMREVASKAGVSAKTVSRVLNNDRYVSDDVRQRVERAVDELKYVPNLLARTFRSGRDAAIGIAVPDIADPFFAAAVQAAEQVARARGVAAFVTSLGSEGQDEQDRVEALLARQVTGLISTPISADQSYLKPWQARVAMVFIDRRPGKLTADSVTEDDVTAAEAAVGHLIGHGHRRIAVLGDALAVATTARRLDGYRRALAEAEIPFDAELIVLEAAPGADVEQVLSRLLADPNPPSALFSSNARCSIAVVPALQSLGRADLAHISFGDFPLAAALKPALTVLDQDPAAVGRAAALRLFDRLDHPNRRLKRQIMLPISLVVRASCGP
jgi:LacI family transcriptional regulator